MTQADGVYRTPAGVPVFHAVRPLAEKGRLKFLCPAKRYADQTA